MSKKVLITGTTGAVGGALLQQFADKGLLEDVSILIRDSKKNRKFAKKYEGKAEVYYGDLREKSSLIEAVKNQDVVVHLGAVIPPLADENEALADAVNIEGTRNVVEAMEEHNPKGFLMYSSSIATYGDRLKNPNIRTTDELNSEQRDNYGRGKIKAEAIIQNSKLDWTIFRLTAIMGIGNHKISGLMFEMPLETIMEICTVRDTARAFLHGVDKTDQLKHKVFNLGGGEQCRISYLDFMTRAFKAFGMGAINFPDYAFAKQNFHCGNYVDGDVLEDILKFRTDDIESYFKRFEASVPAIQRIATLPFGWAVKKYLVTLSHPYKAYKNKDKKEMEYYFGE